MAEIERSGVLVHLVPLHMVVRVILIVAGAVVLVISVLGLHRAVWPLNWLSPLFLLVIAGAFLVGVPMIASGLVGPALEWTVRPGRIELVLTNPFTRRMRTFTPAQVGDISVVRFDDADGPVTWRVVLKSIDGKRYQSRPYRSSDAALRLKADIERIFYAEAT